MKPCAFELGEEPRPFGKEQPLARVDPERDSLQRGVALGGQLHHLGRQRDRQIIDAVEAKVLQHAHRGAAARAGNSGDDEQPRARGAGSDRDCVWLIASALAMEGLHRRERPAAIRERLSIGCPLP